jgi:chloramphenicol-sensitive protein RarD
MSGTPAPSEQRRGFLYAAFVYAFWGITPLYWHQLNVVPGTDVVAHRLMWSAVFIALVTIMRGHLRRAFSVVRKPRIFGMLVLSGVLIGGNWGIYIYCVESNQLVEASLGYFMTPLVSFGLGLAFFGERLTAARWLGVGLAVAALVIQISALGHFPWISPALAISFGLYGYLRKLATVPAMDGLLVETIVLLPIALAFMTWRTVHDGAPPLDHGWITNLLLIGTGPLTAIPLAMFAAGARRVSMTTLGFLQYLTPTLTLVVAVFAFGEEFSQIDVISFGLVWLALVVIALEGHGSRLFARFSAPKSPAETLK